ncbi:hypothetical protein [Desulforamulus aeronauticus]|uniref:Uncharacterized membrane protein YkvI n=1 Tax=Desulforamulus aeronauticus DSM 10349 TaxID=1121421 RepID=A0A1M6T9J6_9FIRM|nr:hypothetical protein [Desulforamulus aeronauticus]SHK53631.1 Uncharacterized membrane protein YkvI [Desulforamulus aeronauticus DSM 10349]
MTKTNDLWLLVRLVATYVGAVIGAGFASGQEILQFFILYGYQGLLGTALASILFAYLGALVLYLSVKLRAGSYQEVLNYLMGSWAGRFMDILSLFMLAGGLGVMLAGSGAVVEEYLGISRWIGIGISLGIVITVIFHGLQGLLTINVILVPVKLLGVCLIASLALAYHGLPEQLVIVPSQGIGGHWWGSSILYVSFNMVVPLAVLASMGRYTTKKIAIYAGILGGLALGGAVTLVTLAGLAFYPAVTEYEVPMLYLASQVSVYLRPLFALLIWLAILTTAVANAHGFASRLAPTSGRWYRIYGIAVCLLVLPLTSLNFSSLVKSVYPLFGYAGLVMLTALLVVPVGKSLRR